MKRYSKLTMQQLLKEEIMCCCICQSFTDMMNNDQLCAQKEHYESSIKLNPEWDFAGLYYDEGLSATKKDNRRV